ncbi:iron-sulfur protein [Kitasatospora sp. NBC_00315]|uniref:iron-sulfur protein n=1 Tax=Kitasatospora sp. NBC_00315 TaxID=2975963 RepID=UPI00324E7E75
MTVSSASPCPPPVRTARPPGAGPGANTPALHLAGAPRIFGYARLTEAFPGVRVHGGAPRTGDGWISGADLLADRAAVRELIAFDARQGLERYGRPLRPDVAAGFCLHRYCWPAGLLFTLPWLWERRVPRLAAEAVSIRRRTGELTADPAGFSCLPDDPAAGLPGARVVADAAALRGELLRALAEHLSPVLAAFRPELRRGPRTLWACATDAVVEGLWQVATRLGEEERAVAALARLLPPPPAATGPFVGGAGFRAASAGRAGASADPGCAATGSSRTRDRAGCCLLYTVRPEQRCAGCPRATRS